MLHGDKLEEFVFKDLAYRGCRQIHYINREFKPNDRIFFREIDINNKCTGNGMMCLITNVFYKDTYWDLPKGHCSIELNVIEKYITA